MPFWKKFPGSRGCPVRSSNHYGSHTSSSSCNSSSIIKFSSLPKPPQSPSSSPSKSSPAQSSYCSRSVSCIARQNSAGYSGVTFATLPFSCTCVCSWLQTFTQNTVGGQHVRQKPTSLLAGAVPISSVDVEPCMHGSNSTTSTESSCIRATNSGSVRDEASRGCTKMKYLPDFIWNLHARTAMCRRRTP